MNPWIWFFSLLPMRLMNVHGPFSLMLCQSIPARRVSGSGQPTLRRVMGQGKNNLLTCTSWSIVTLKCFSKTVCSVHTCIHRLNVNSKCSVWGWKSHVSSYLTFPGSLWNLCYRGQWPIVPRLRSSGWWEPSPSGWQ